MHDPLNPTEAEEYILIAMYSFVGDPPDSDFQSGYLAALKAVATEGMGITLSPEVARIDTLRTRPVLTLVQ